MHCDFGFIVEALRPYGSPPNGLAEVDVVLIGQGARCGTTGAADQRAAEDATSRYSTDRGTGTGTDRAAAQRAVGFARTACAEQKRGAKHCGNWKNFHASPSSAV